MDQCIENFKIFKTDSKDRKSTFIPGDCFRVRRHNNFKNFREIIIQVPL